MLIELPIDLKSVYISNPDSLDASVQSPRQVYLLAKKVGSANAFFHGPDGQKLVLLEVTIVRDFTALTDALNRLLAGARIRAEPLGDNVVLTGVVTNSADVDRAVEIAGRYINRKDAVVNMLVVPVPSTLAAQSLPSDTGLEKAAPQNIGHSRNVTARGDGKRLLMAHSSWNEQCKPKAAPRIEIVTKPTHGIIAFDPAIQTVDEPGNQCRGQRIPGNGVFYTAKNGYRGTDAVVYRLIWTDKSSDQWTLSITVE
jgi:hypothetical protein